MGKNLQKIQDMVDGKFTGYKTQVGYTPERVDRKVGEKWTDSDGVEWEQKEGYRAKISKLPAVGIFSKQCSDCEKACVDKMDKSTHVRMGRCYNCQIHFEEELKWNPKNRIGEKNNKYFFWVKLQQLKRWDSMEKDNELIIEQLQRERESVNFDKSVANALANGNVDFNIKKNKNL